VELARRRDGPRDRGSALAGEKGGGQARPLPRRRQPRASASEAGTQGGAAGGGNRRKKAWKEGYVTGGAAAAFGGESGRALLLSLLLSEREGEVGSAAGAADEGERMEGEAGHGCRAACVAGAWQPRGERRLTRSGAARENRRGAAQRRPDARAGLGRTRGVRAAGAVAGRAGFGRGPRKEAAARERRNHFSQFPFLRNF